MKLLSLLKALLSTDMNLFKYSAKRNSSKLNKILFPIFLFGFVSFTIGTMCFSIAYPLSEIKMTHVMLGLYIMLVTVLNFIEGIYKSQGILFEAKDNDLLFSLPIKKYQILFLRIFKLLVFQYLYNLMFLLPAFLVYIFLEHPGINFYIISSLMTILVPIIPTVISAFLGYAVKLISSKFKAKKIIQALLSGMIFLVIFSISFKSGDFVENIASQANSINDLITKIYYPVGLYLNLIFKFELLDFIKLIAINLVPFTVFIAIAQKYYFKVISDNKSKQTLRRTKNKKIEYEKRSKINALIIKELKRYFSSFVYMFNSSFGLLLCVVLTIMLCFKGQDSLNEVLGGIEISADLQLAVIFYFIILFSTLLTSITSSSISLEGSTINITKSMPVKESIILKAKIFTCFIIELPFILASDVIFIATTRPSIWYIFLILGISFIGIFTSACLGLIINLKYPKMDAASDTEVVKQSMSSMISVFIGTGIFFVSIIATAISSIFVSLNIAVFINFSVILGASIVFYVILMKNGVKEYRKINV